MKDHLPNINHLESTKGTLEEKEIVNRIEKLKTDDVLKAKIILAWRGLKPGTIFNVDYDSENEEGRAGDIDEVEELFKAMNIFFHRKTIVKEHMVYDKGGKNPVPTKFFRDMYYIAKNKDDLDYLLDHFGTEKSGDVDRDNVEAERMGVIFGYPKSAIDAFIKNDISVLMPNIKESRPDLYNRDEMAFRQFIFSRENLDEEFETVKRWAGEVKLSAPELYRKIVEHHQHYLHNEY